jgi:hypothetical protein
MMGVSSLFRLGVKEGMDSETRRVIYLTNGMYLTVILLSAIYLIVFYPFEPVQLDFNTWVPIIIFITGLASLVLATYHLHTLAKTVFMLIWILFVTVLPVVITGTQKDSYILHPFYCILSSVMVHLLFSYYKERVVYISFLIIVWSLILFSVEFISYYQLPDNGKATLFVNGFFKWRVITFIFAAFFNITIFYVLQINHDFYSALQKRNETISEQNQQLEEQRKSLQVLTNQLEEKVAKRTEILNKQNVQLSEYSFFNAHILRAPISRIRGLLNLLSHKLDNDEEARVRGLLKENMAELDQAISLINNKLQQAEQSE